MPGRSWGALMWQQSMALSSHQEMDCSMRWVPNVHVHVHACDSACVCLHTTGTCTCVCIKCASNSFWCCACMRAFTSVVAFFMMKALECLCYSWWHDIHVIYSFYIYTHLPCLCVCVCVGCEWPYGAWGLGGGHQGAHWYAANWIWQCSSCLNSAWVWVS